MKLIKPSWEILEQKPELEGIYQQIETAGRTCYKSTRPEGKTAKDFVDMLIKNKHWAMLEHGTVYLDIWINNIVPAIEYGQYIRKYTKYQENPYSKVTLFKNNTKQHAYISTNYRVLVEQNWLDDLKYLCEPTEYHEKRATVRFVTSIGVGRELLRHRAFSFANESTRYCNYSKDKFNNEVAFICPRWLKELMDRTGMDLSETFTIGEGYSNEEINRIIDFDQSLRMSESCYMHMIQNGAKPQEAREVLSLATKSELIMTGFISDWRHVFELRSSIAATGQPHPDCKALIDPLMQEFKNRKLI